MLQYLCDELFSNEKRNLNNITNRWNQYHFGQTMKKRNDEGIIWQYCISMHMLAVSKKAKNSTNNRFGSWSASFAINIYWITNLLVSLRSSDFRFDVQIRYFMCELLLFNHDFILLKPIVVADQQFDKFSFHFSTFNFIYSYFDFVEPSVFLLLLNFRFVLSRQSTVNSQSTNINVWMYSNFLFSTLIKKTNHVPNDQIKFKTSWKHILLYSSLFAVWMCNIFLF